MDFVSWLHHFLLKIEKDLGESGLLLGQCKNRFVHNLQSERSLNAFSMRVGDMKLHAGFRAGPVNGRVGCSVNFQFVRGLDEEQSMVGDRLRIAAEEIGVDVERPSHLRCSRKCKFGFSVLEIEIASEDGLPIPDNVHIGRASSARRQNFELNAIAGLAGGAIRMQQNLVSASTCLKGNLGAGAIAMVVVGFDVERLTVGVRIHMIDGNSRGIGC